MKRGSEIGTDMAFTVAQSKQLRKALKLAEREAQAVAEEEAARALEEHPPRGGA